jgi:hypothetical protein
MKKGLIILLMIWIRGLKTKRNFSNKENYYIKLDKFVKTLPSFHHSPEPRELFSVTVKEERNHIKHDLSDNLFSYENYKEEVDKFEKKESINYQCNPKILELFSLAGPKLKFARTVSIKENIRCKLAYSCCDKKNIDNFEDRMAKNIHTLRMRYRAYIDTFTILNSNKVYEYIRRNQKSSICKEILMDQERKLETSKGETFFDLRDKEQFDDYLKETNMMRIHFENYIKHNERYMAEVICSVCNAENHKYFTFDENGEEPVKVEINIDLCQHSLDWHRFFYNFQLLFRDFFSRIIDFIGCVEKKTFKNWANNEFFFSSQIENNSCQDKIDINNPECLSFCSEYISLHKVATFFNMSNMVKKMNEILFNFFTHQNFEKHYSENLKTEFYTGTETLPISFNPAITTHGESNSLKYIKYIWVQGFGFKPDKNFVSDVFYKEVEEKIDYLIMGEFLFITYINLLLFLIV